MPAPPSNSTAKSAGKIMAAILGSRLLGLAREMVLSGIFGASRELDALKVAFRIPNMLRDLFAEGALSSAFVPTFSKLLVTDGRPAALRLASLVFNALLVTLGVVCLLGVLCSGPIVSVIAPDFAATSGKLPLTVTLTQIMFPFILFAALAALYMGLLNSLGSFGLPASASMAFNLVSIVSGVVIAWCLDHTFADKEKCVYGFAGGVLLGGLAQWLIQAPRARQLGFRHRLELDWRDRGLLKVIRLMGPAIIGVSAVQINVLVMTRFAASFGNGAVTWLDNAFRLTQLPIGLFGVAISMVTLPAVSRSAAVHNMDEFRRGLRAGLRYMLFLAVPATVGLWLLATPVISALFQWGAYTAADVARTAGLLRYYTVGLLGYAAIKVLAPAFYSLNRPLVPTLVSVSGIGLNLALIWLAVSVLRWDLFSLPLAVSLAALLNAALLWLWLHRRVGVIADRAFMVSAGKILLATLLMAALVRGLYYFVTASVGDGGKIFTVVQALILSGAGVLAYFTAAWLLGLEEIRRLWQALTVKLFNSGR
ncbi:MAG: murein biosynthesis integral membrane protein MurJ [Verrucomicrobiales bacterium]|jgi:putative peptidoglycan lipid II flippase|nr:murein biosynthesis integral membrane protein MurJ [Verrucomicrobiales bacterium]